MKLSLYVVVSLLFLRPAFGQVVISEVMFDPSGSEFTDEFIEVQNVGDEAVDLAGWRVGDGDETDALVPLSGGTWLGPGAFGLILDAGYPEGSRPYDPLPEGVLVLTVEDATLGQDGLANGRGEPVVLVAASGDTVGVARYSPGNAPGYSEEKVHPAGGDGPENWGDSRWAGGTPGRVNSLSPKRDDLAIEIGSETPFAVRAGETRGVALRVINRGMRASGRFGVEVLGANGAVRWTAEGEAVSPGDSLEFSYPVSGSRPGRERFSAVVSFSADQDTSNNRATWVVVFGTTPLHVVVNEVMFAPAPGASEWVEVLNRSDVALDLAGWQVRDRRAGIGGRLEGAPLYLPPGAYAVIAEDAAQVRSQYPDAGVVVTVSGWAGLNDGGDAVVIRDATGTVVDSMVYDGTAVVPGKSLERIDPEGASTAPENWLISTAIAGATPGGANSVVFRDEETQGTRLAVSPNPFRDRAEITYALPVKRADVNLWVFDRLGRQVRSLLSAETGGGRRGVVWDGLGENGAVLKPGIYILYLEAIGPDGRMYRTRAPVVFTRGL